MILDYLTGILILRRLVDPLASVYDLTTFLDSTTFDKQNQIITELTDIPWAPLPNQGTVAFSTELPQSDLITSVHVFCFEGNALLLVNHNERGWGIPGGHIEPGESPVAAVERELLEESGVVATGLNLFATLRLEVLCPKPSTVTRREYPYPVSFLCFFIAELGEKRSFSADFETSERTFLEPTEVRSLAWYLRNKALCEAALFARSGANR